MKTYGQNVVEKSQSWQIGAGSDRITGLAEPCTVYDIGGNPITTYPKGAQGLSVPSFLWDGQTLLTEDFRAPEEHLIRVRGPAQEVTALYLREDRKFDRRTVSAEDVMTDRPYGYEVKATGGVTLGVSGREDFEALSAARARAV